jgi:TRAP-type C4-dicarboxylate transport system permease small subunit
MAPKGFKVYKIVNGIHVSSVVLAMVLMVVMTIIIAVNVFMRYVLNMGLFWAEEVSKLFVVWFTFISMAVGVKQDLHISIHIIPKNLPKWLDLTLIQIKNLIVAALAVVMFIHGNTLVGITSKSIMPATQWPSSILYLVLPITGILIFLETIFDMFQLKDHPEEIEQLFDRGNNHAEQ